METRFYHFKGAEVLHEYGYNGITVCYLIDDEGRFSEGWAVCSPKDQFSRPMGRRIAQGRAVTARNAGLCEEIPQGARLYRIALDCANYVLDYYAHERDLLALRKKHGKLTPELIEEAGYANCTCCEE